MSRGSFGIAANAPLFGSAMRLSEQKNPLGLIDAFARVADSEPRAELIVAGEGTLREATLERAAAAGLGRRVHLIGARDDLHRFYPMLDVFVLPSHYEGLPLALLEAMAAGCRIAVTGVGQIPAVLQGLSVVPAAPGDPLALAAAMSRALAQAPDPELRDRVLTHYSVDSMAAAYASTYAEALSEHERAVA
jgi:glycosyltransferase involved in cell wall biosynthesis